MALQFQVGEKGPRTERRYINHHVLYLDEGAKETWGTFIIISEGRHREDQWGHMGRGMQCLTNAQNAERRMQDASQGLRQTRMVMWVRKVWHVHGIGVIWDSGPGYCLVVHKWRAGRAGGGATI